MHKKVAPILSEQEAVSNVEPQLSSAVTDGLLHIKLKDSGEVFFDAEEAISGVVRDYHPEAAQALLKEIDAHLGIRHYDLTLSFGELMEREFPKARYVLEPFFEAGTVNMVSAPPNTWKSWLLFYFASHIAAGTPVLGKFPTEQCKVMIVNEEDSFRAIQDRFNLLSITDRTLPIFFRVAQGSKLETKFIQEIIHECKDRDIKCVMFDSLRSMHEGNENDSTEMQLVLDKMKAVAREGITVIFTHHHRKKSMFSKGDDAEASRGSSAINAAISGHLSLEEEERDSGTFLIVRHLKSKAGEKIQPIEIKIEKKLDGVGFVYEGEYKSGERKLVASKDAILYALKPGEWKTAADFVDLDIAGQSIVRAALNELTKQGALVAITRAEARKRNLVPLSGGKVNEKLYALPSEESEAARELFDSLDEI